MADFTVKELREALEAWPDEAPVVVETLSDPSRTFSIHHVAYVGNGSVVIWPATVERDDG